MSPSKEWAFSTEGKEEKFSNEGFEVMKIHSVIRAQIVERFLELKKIAQIIRRHQEHMNGSGYPEGLRGDQIPFYLRCSLFVMFKHFDRKQTLRKAYSSVQALKIVKKCH
ncbi:MULTISPECIES: HD-GYP domain-containing protein [Pseudothermotoga]|uniref:HD-GYP domain-containing protein n=1 Tax=Pseudothermotoga TaxID=1643951 RepID=UPI001E4CEC8D|nr:MULTISPECIES: HD domain-containing phosphohydrolase [Pseudothermotoga]